MTLTGTRRFHWFSSAHSNQSASRQTAACRGGCSHAVQTGCHCPADPLCLPCGECARSCAADSVQPEGNTRNTIQYKYRGSVPVEAAADSRPGSGTRSLLFEINIWMWRYRRTFPRGFSVADAVAMRKQRVQESRAQGAATLERRRTAKQVAQAARPGMLNRYIIPDVMCYILPDVVPDIIPDIASDIVVYLRCWLQY
jgi:hypothetical protein